MRLAVIYSGCTRGLSAVTEDLYLHNRVRDRRFGRYLLAVSASGRYGIMLHCRMIQHGIEVGKAGRVGLIARSSSQFHRLSQLLLASRAPDASGL